MTLRLVGLYGVASAGKDELALALKGWVNCPFSHGIKAFFDEYAHGEMSVHGLKRAMFGANPKLSEDQWKVFMDTVIWPFEEADTMCSAFTERRDEKAVIRPILEHGGQLIYDHVFRAYFNDLDDRLARGQRVVNTRVCRVDEARAFVDRGGELYEVIRPGVEPCSDWEVGMIEGLRASGLTTGRVINSGTLEQWHDAAAGFAIGLDARHG